MISWKKLVCYLYATKSNVLFVKGMKYLKPESLHFSVESEGETKFSARGSKASEVFAVL